MAEAVHESMTAVEDQRLQKYQKVHERKETQRTRTICVSMFMLQEILSVDPMLVSWLTIEPVQKDMYHLHRL